MSTHNYRETLRSFRALVTPRLELRLRTAPPTPRGNVPPPGSAAPAASTAAAGGLAALPAWAVQTTTATNWNGSVTAAGSLQAVEWLKNATKAEQPSPTQPNKETVVAELRLYDAIGADFFGSGITDEDVAQALEGAKGAHQLLVYVNSPGGDVFQAVAIHTLLSRFAAPKHVVVDGLAASAASFIAMVGDTITMAPSAMMMIHNPWGQVVGDAADMRAAADLLDKVGGTLVAGYTARTGLKAERVQKLMAAETWMTAEEAIGLGFADKVGTGADDDNDANSEPDDDEDDRKAAAAARSAAILNQYSKTPQRLRPDARALIASMERRASPLPALPAGAAKK